MTSLFLEYAIAKQNCPSEAIRLRNKIVEENLGLAKKVANQYSRRCKESFEDLLNIGTIGLIKAVEYFDPAKEVKFSNLAIPKIRGEILHWLRDKGHLIQVPRKFQESHQQINRVAIKTGKSYEETAIALGYSQEEAIEARSAYAQSFSPLVEELPEIEYDSEEVETTEVHLILQKLRPQEQMVLACRILQGISIKDTAIALSLKQKQVKQIEASAINNLRCAMNGRSQCHHCLSFQSRKFGKKRGKQVYMCNDCDRTFVLNPQRPWGASGYSSDTKTKAIKFLSEGRSWRWICIQLGIPLDRNAILSYWQKTAKS